MTDLALRYQDGLADLVFDGGDLAVDETLLSAVLVSLFTDRHAEPSDVLPDGSTDRRGWWADVWLEEGDLHGSRLWLLSRSKDVAEVPARARDYALEALAWLERDGVAQRVEVMASVPRKGWLQLKIVITRLSGDVEEFSMNLDLLRGVS